MSTYTYNIIDFANYVEKTSVVKNVGAVDTYGTGTTATCRSYRSASSTSDYTATERRMYTEHTAVLPDYITADDTVFSSMVLSFTLRGNADNYSTLGFYAVFPDSAFTDVAQEIWNLTASGTTAGRIYANPGVTSTTDVTVTDSNTIKKFLKYGVALRLRNAPSYSTTIRDDYVTCIAIEVTLDFQSTQLPPEIAITSPETENYFSITDPIPLTWSYTQSAGVEPERFVIYYEDSGDWKVWTETAGDIRGVELYAAILQRTANVDNYTINVRVRGYLNDTVYNDAPTISITIYFVDCVDLSPSGGEIQIASETIRLSWSVALAEGAPVDLVIGNPPTNYQIQYSTNSGESWNIITDDTEAGQSDGMYYYDVSANTFPNGIITWRVRPWVNGYTIDNYVKETFVVHVQASTSAVTCDGKPQPTLSWTSSSQVAYQVRFSDYDSGAIYGTETSYTVPYYYADGNYPVQVRTQASNGIWSAWTELEYVTITNEPVDGDITLAALVSRHAVVLSWTPSQDYVNYILYRNGIPVYVGADLTYTDLAANGNAVYTLRGIASSGYYTQSNAVTVDATPKTDCMYDMESQSWIPLKLSLSARTRSYDNSVQTYYKYYAGRTKPIAFTEGNTDRRLSVSYVFKTREEAERILNLAGKLVIYKDTNGGVIIGILSDPGYQSGKVYPVSFNITEVDYDEAVKYEAVSV